MSGGDGEDDDDDDNDYDDVCCLFCSCTGCNCDSAGSTNTTCQVITGQCQCKQFVEGRRCDTCVAGSSYLEASNPYGCSKGTGLIPSFPTRFKSFKKCCPFICSAIISCFKESCVSKHEFFCIFKESLIVVGGKKTFNLSLNKFCSLVPFPTPLCYEDMKVAFVWL